MRYAAAFLLLPLAVPLAAQAWDLRVEAPFAHGQSLPGVQVQGAGQLRDGGLDRGKGLILSVNHRIIRVNPVLRLDWTLEYSQLKADGQLLGAVSGTTQLKQHGFGAGVNAQFWVPFSGVAGELGVIQRFQDYRYTAAGLAQDHTLSRTWLRVGARWRIPMPELAPYFAASYQCPISKNSPVSQGSTANLSSHLAAQQTGQEFDHMWTFGVGVQF